MALSRSPSQTNRVFWLMVLVLLLAAALRVLGTTDQSLWLDEGFTYNVIVRAESSWAAMFAEIQRDTHPPLYFVLLRLWTLAAGDSVLALRLFSGWTALLSVAVVYRLGRRLAPAGWVPVVAALMLALWDADIFLAQETRMYALRTLLACLSMWFYLRWWHVPSVGRAVPWVLATAAIMYTQYLGGWVPLVQGLHLLLFRRGRGLVAGVGALAAAGALFAPWFIGVTLGQAATPPDYEMLNAPPSNWVTLLDLRQMYFGALWGFMLGLVAVGLWVWRGAYGTLIGLWLALPVVGTFAANTQFPLLMPRNLSLITPAAALLVAGGVVWFQRPARLMLLFGLVAYMLTTVDYYRPKPPWDELGAAITRHAAPADAALMEVGNGGYPLRYYLDKGVPPAAPVINLPRARADAPTTYYADLDVTLAAHDTVWLAHWSPEDEIFDLLAAAGFQRTGTTTIDHVGNALNAHRYDRLPPEPVAVYQNGLVLRLAEVGAAGVRLVWEPAQPLERDYSISAFALHPDGTLAAQHDVTPPTSGWAPGASVYLPLALDWDALPPGEYPVGVRVYTWQDGAVVPTEAGDDYTEIGEIRR